MKTIFIIIALLISYTSFATNCRRHPIYCQIIRNKPKIDKKYAMKLSNIIYKMYIKYKIPSKIYAGILMQESSYMLKAKGCHEGVVFKNKTEIEEERLDCIDTLKVIEGTEIFINMTKILHCTKKIIKFKKVKVCSDFGIGQIYFKTAQAFGFDLVKLTKDLEYSVEAGAIVLKDFMDRYQSREIDWWTRYNASSRIKRKIYKKLVERYF